VSGEGKNILPNDPTKEGPLLDVLHEFPYASVSTVVRSHPLSSLSGADNQIKSFKSFSIILTT
jgi:hypothetical protein